MSVRRTMRVIEVKRRFSGNGSYFYPDRLPWPENDRLPRKVKPKKKHRRRFRRNRKNR